MKTSLRKSLGVASLLSLSMIVASQSHAAVCSYTLNNEWNTGFQGTISITNDGTTAINGWTVGWSYANNRITSSWNATLSGSNPYTASGLSWNSTIQPGQSVSFGVQGNKNAATAEIPTITGDVCGGVASSSVPSTPASSSSAPSSIPPASSSSLISISSSSVASQCAAVSQCNWYCTLYPTCDTTVSGWGYENGRSCISNTTCASQPSPFGVVAGCGVVSSSAATTSSSSSIVSSSSVATTSSSESSSSVMPVSSSSISSSSSSSLSSSIVSSSVASSSAVSVSSSSAASAGPRLDNPFVGAQWYIDPIWSAKAMAETGGSKVANYNTAVWMDRIGAIAPTDGSWGLRDHLDAALDQNANVIQVVVYDLPNRDCHALASNGELKQTAEDTARYRSEYVDAIAGIFADPKYKDLRIIAIIEPDSLPNLVTNMSDPDCAQAAQGPYGYIPNTQYTLNKLYPITNVYSYMDIGHSGWLGWADNFSQAITLIGNAVKGTTAGVNSLAGFVSNTSGYTPLEEPFLDPFSMASLPGNNGTQVRQASFYEWNPHFSELSFVKAWRNAMIANGFPSTLGMLVDTSRNGWGGANRPSALSTSTQLETFVNDSRLDKRSHRGNWCNQRGGIGERPRAVGVDGVDAYVWVKPPGESDGAASLELSYDPLDPAKGFDQMCSPTYTRTEGGLTVTSGAMANAPVAGRWFPEGFKQLLDNAYPPLD